jgi:hypothetical protein
MCRDHVRFARDLGSRGGISRRPSAFQSGGKASRALHNCCPICPARAFRRGGDDGVDHGVERAADNQRLGDSQHAARCRRISDLASANPSCRNASIEDSELQMMDASERACSMSECATHGSASGYNSVSDAVPARKSVILRKTCAKISARPHDFAVRAGTTRQLCRQRPPHPAPRFVTIASRPFGGTGCAD